MMRRKPESKPWWPSHLSPPTPQQFGLEPGFDPNAYLATHNKRKAQRDKQITFVSILIGFGMMIVLFQLMWGKVDVKIWSNWTAYIGPAWLGLIASVPIQVGVKELYKRRNPNPFPPNIQRYFDALVAFDAAVKDYNDRQLETGLTYWREKRGVAFESALEGFFSRRGCNVQTTKGSGDGGIDLIVHLCGKTFWCQAKGHAAPVGVAAIREIAGVCSRGGGSPVVIAVNGYTASAVSTANELGVVLLDTPNLVRMAGNERLTALA